MDEIEKKIQELEKKGVKVVLELDSYGHILACGTEEQYDTHAVDVLNGNGYYDELGNYVSYHIHN